MGKFITEERFAKLEKIVEEQLQKEALEKARAEERKRLLLIAKDLILVTCALLGGILSVVGYFD